MATHTKALIDEASEIIAATIDAEIPDRLD